MNLTHKVALVTGGARIGAVVAQELARRGADVVLTYRSSKSAAETTVRDIENLGRRAVAVKADLTKGSDVKRLFQNIQKTFGRLHVVVNMASVYERIAWKNLSERSFHERLDTDLKTAYLTVLHGAPLLRKEGGRVINFSDWTAASGRPHYRSYVPYYTAKSGLLGLTQAQALELAPHVLVNAIAPGPILPPHDLSTRDLNAVKKATPLARWGGAQEIARAVVFLSETDFVTGECIRVDGGRHLL